MLEKFKFYEHGSLALLSIMIITLAPFTQLGKLAFYLLLIISIVFFFKNIKKITIDDKNIKFVFTMLLAWFFWTVLTNLLNGIPELSHRSLWRREAYIVAMIPLYFLFKSYPPNKKALLVVLVVASIVLILRGGYEFVFLSVDRYRGGENPIQLASIATLLFIILSAVLLFNNPVKVLRSIIYFSLLCLFCSVLMSKSRGVWIAYPAILLFIINCFLKNFSTKRKVGSFFLLCVLLISSYFIPVVKERADIAVKNVIDYSESDNVSESLAGKTSIGTRFEMWKAGWFIFTEHPLFGVGLGGYKEAAVEHQKKYDFGDNAYIHYHPHNQYISELSTKGLIGLILFILFLFSLYQFFHKGFHDKKISYFLYFTGIQAVILISILCLTNATFEAKSMVLAMAVYFALLLSWVEDSPVRPNNDAYV